MLTELLALLNTGGLHSMCEVAQQMGVSESLVADLADGLARRGYLVPVSAGCGSAAACAGCSVEPMCSTGGRPTARILALTEQGRRAASGPKLP